MLREPGAERSDTMSIDDEERGAEREKEVKGASLVAVVEALEAEVNGPWRGYGDEEEEEDGGAGALLDFLMDLQATALASFGGGPEFDPKLYVDLPLKCALEATQAAFAALPRTGAARSLEPGSRQAPRPFSKTEKTLGPR
jgi:hypothetical protein